MSDDQKSISGTVSEEPTLSGSAEEDLLVSEKLAPGATLGGRYEIIRTLGSGGMGTVCLASDRLFPGENIAVKILHSEFSKDDRQTQRFLREVQLMRKVNHPNIVRTFDLGIDGQLIYFTMEYVEGFSLSDIIRRKTLPQNQLPQIIIQVCQGLEVIHSAKIIHRDLKPGNIILTMDGLVKITDFGVARPQNSDLTAHNEVIGSASYMAPEIWLGKTLTPAVDLYSLGVVLYVLATGRLPFDSDSAATLMRMHIDREPVPPREINKSLDHWLNKLILRLLSKSPQDRPRSAREVIDIVARHAPAKTGEQGENRTVARSFISMLEERSRESLATKTGPAAPRGLRNPFRPIAWIFSGPTRALLLHRILDRYRYSQRYARLRRRLAPKLEAFGIALLLAAAAAASLSYASSLLPQNVFSLLLLRSGIVLAMLSLPAAILGSLSGSLANAFRAFVFALGALCVAQTAAVCSLILGAPSHAASSELLIHALAASSKQTAAVACFNDFPIFQSYLADGQLTTEQLRTLPLLHSFLSAVLSGGWMLLLCLISLTGTRGMAGAIRAAAALAVLLLIIVELCQAFPPAAGIQAGVLPLIALLAAAIKADPGRTGN